MNWRRVLVLSAVAVVLLPARPAGAAPTLIKGQEILVLGQCPVDLNFYIQLRTYTGYFADPALSLPKTGDITYVVAVAINASPCGLTDAPRFDFFLPDGASFAVSPATPVRCFRGIVGSTSAPLPNDSTGRCLQTPIAGDFGGANFGFARLAPGEFLEIQVPMVFNKKLLGPSGPQSHSFAAQITSAFVMMDVIPFVPVTVVYEADFENLNATGVTATSANVVFDLKSYFHAGTLFVDYGTTPSVTSSVPPANVPDTQLSFLGNTAPLSGLTPSTTYYWRARFVTTDGTFLSPVQSFSTSGGSMQLLTVAKFGDGVVTSAPAGISCGAACSANFAAGTSVTLTAAPGAGWLFGGWSGDCAGTGTCMVVMTAARNVNASFARQMGSLSVTVSGLPAGASVNVTITGPDGFNITRSITTGFGVLLSDVPTGSYVVTAPSTTVMGVSYAPASPSQTVTVASGPTTSVSVVYSQAALPPTTVVAAAISSTAVSITWNASGTGTFEVQRVGPGGATVTVGSSSAGALVDTSASPNTAYLYRVRQVVPVMSAYSASDLATTVIFTDPVLTSARGRGGAAPVRAVHFTELRTAINAVRALAGFGAATYSTPTLAAGMIIRSSHLTELRAALAPAYVALELPSLTFTTPGIAAGTPIRATDISDLRNAVR